MQIPGKINKYEIINIIKKAINEDMGGYGDITSKYSIPEASKSSAYIICKEKDEQCFQGLTLLVIYSSRLTARLNSKK